MNTEQLSQMEICVVLHAEAAFDRHIRILAIFHVVPLMECIFLNSVGEERAICPLLFTCNYVVSVWRGLLFLWVLGMGYVILLWHSLSLPYNYVLLAKVCSHVDDFNARNKCLTAKLLKHGYMYHKFRKAFSKFYRWHHELVSIFQFRITISFTSRPIGFYSDF